MDKYNDVFTTEDKADAWARKVAKDNKAKGWYTTLGYVKHYDGTWDYGYHVRFYYD